MNSYTISLTNTFDAESPEDAVRQMADYVSLPAMRAGYRVEWSDMFWPGHDHSVFIDADRIDFDSIPE